MKLITDSHDAKLLFEFYGLSRSNHSYEVNRSLSLCGTKTGLGALKKKKLMVILHKRLKTYFLTRVPNRDRTHSGESPNSLETAPKISVKEIENQISDVIYSNRWIHKTDLMIF